MPAAMLDKHLLLGTTQQKFNAANQGKCFFVECCCAPGEEIPICVNLRGKFENQKDMSHFQVGLTEATSTSVTAS